MFCKSTTFGGKSPDLISTLVPTVAKYKWWNVFQSLRWSWYLCGSSQGLIIQAFLQLPKHMCRALRTIWHSLFQNAAGRPFRVQLVKLVQLWVFGGILLGHRSEHFHWMFRHGFGLPSAASGCRFCSQSLHVEVKFSSSFCLCLEYFELSWFVCFWP